jgi:hypothetical protein
MTAETIIPIVWGAGLIILLVAVALARRGRRRGGSLTAGVIGATYEWQSEDKRKALELIVEKKAEARRPEYPDGNLPDLESPKKDS